MRWTAGPRRKLRFVAALRFWTKSSPGPNSRRHYWPMGRFRQGDNTLENRSLIKRALRLFEEMNATGWIEERPVPRWLPLNQFTAGIAIIGVVEHRGSLPIVEEYVDVLCIMTANQEAELQKACQELKAV